MDTGRETKGMEAEAHQLFSHFFPAEEFFFVLVGRVLDDGLRFARDARPDFLVQAEGIKAVDVFFRMRGEGSRDEYRRAFVR